LRRKLVKHVNWNRQRNPSWVAIGWHLFCFLMAPFNLVGGRRLAASGRTDLIDLFIIRSAAGAQWLLIRIECGHRWIRAEFVTVGVEGRRFVMPLEWCCCNLGWKRCGSAVKSLRARFIFGNAESNMI